MKHTLGSTLFVGLVLQFLLHLKRAGLTLYNFQDGGVNDVRL